MFAVMPAAVRACAGYCWSFRTNPAAADASCQQAPRPKLADGGGFAYGRCDQQYTYPASAGCPDRCKQFASSCKMCKEATQGSILTCCTAPNSHSAGADAGCKRIRSSLRALLSHHVAADVITSASPSLSAWCPSGGKIANHVNTSCKGIELNTQCAETPLTVSRRARRCLRGILGQLRRLRQRTRRV